MGRLKQRVPECPYATTEKFDKAKLELLCRAYGIAKVYGKVLTVDTIRFVGIGEEV